MKKKVLAVLLGGCMVVGMLAGCGSKADDTKKADGDTKTEGSGDSKDIISDCCKELPVFILAGSCTGISIETAVSSVLQLTVRGLNAGSISLTRLTC